MSDFKNDSETKLTKKTKIIQLDAMFEKNGSNKCHHFSRAETPQTANRRFHVTRIFKTQSERMNAGFVSFQTTMKHY